MVFGAMHGVAVRSVLLLCFRSSVVVNSGRVRVGMSTLAPFVVNPGAVLCASPSKRGLDTSVMMERTCAIGWRSWELPSIFVCPSCDALVFCDAPTMAATLCRVLRGQPLVEAGPWDCFQEEFVVTLAAAGAAPRGALETDRFLYVFEFCGPCVIPPRLIAGTGMGILSTCSVSPWIGKCLSEFLSPDGFWNESDSSTVFCVLRLYVSRRNAQVVSKGEKVKITEDSSLTFAGHVGPSQVMYGIQAAAACPVVACAGPLALNVGWQPQSAAACAGMPRALVGLLASVGVLDMAWHFSCALGSCFSFVEGLDRHVLARSLSSGTGEQAPGRVDVPGKDIQQQAAAAKETPSMCFFVKSLGGASYVVKMEHHATVARVRQHVALSPGVCEDVFYLVREGKVLRDGDALESLGAVRNTQLHMCSHLRGGAGVGRQPQILGQWVCQSCGMGGCWPTRQSCYRCGAPRLGGNRGQRP